MAVIALVTIVRAKIVLVMTGLPVIGPIAIVRAPIALLVIGPVLIVHHPLARTVIALGPIALVQIVRLAAIVREQIALPVAAKAGRLVVIGRVRTGLPVKAAAATTCRVLPMRKRTAVQVSSSLKPNAALRLRSNFRSGLTLSLSLSGLQFVAGRFSIVAHEQISPGEHRRVPGSRAERCESAALVKLFRRRIDDGHVAHFQLHHE